MPLKAEFTTCISQDKGECHATQGYRGSVRLWNTEAGVRGRPGPEEPLLGYTGCFQLPGTRL